MRISIRDYLIIMPYKYTAKRRAATKGIVKHYPKTTKRIRKRWQSMNLEQELDVKDSVCSMTFAEYFKAFQSELEQITTTLVIKSLKMHVNCAAGVVGNIALQVFNDKRSGFTAEGSAFKTIPGVLTAKLYPDLNNAGLSGKTKLEDLLRRTDCGFAVALTATHTVSIKFVLKIVYLMQSVDFTKVYGNTAWTIPTMYLENNPAAVNARSNMMLYEYLSGTSLSTR